MRTGRRFAGSPIVSKRSSVEYDDELSVADHALVRPAALLAAAADVSPPSMSVSYVLSHFAGMDFAYATVQSALDRLARMFEEVYAAH